MKPLKLHISEKSYNKKPTVSEIKEISSTILNKTTSYPSLEDFAKDISELGKAVVLPLYKIKILKKDTRIVQQDIVMLDFDNTNPNKQYTINDLMEDEWMQENACFYYRTFSDKNSKVDKFRVVFKLNMTVHSPNLIEDIYQGLFKLYPQADATVGQTSRIFFGSNRGYEEINFDNTIDTIKVRDKGKSVIRRLLDLPPKYMIDRDKNEIIDLNTPVYRLLQLKKFELAKEKLKGKHTGLFGDVHSAVAYFRQQNIQELFEMPKGNPFLDIFHEEKNPSASVFFADDVDIYLYKCHSSSAKFQGDIISVVHELVDTSSLVEAIEFLVEITDCKIDFSSEIGREIANGLQFRKDLLSGQLEKYSPNLYSYLKRYTLEISATLELMYEYIYEDSITGETLYMNYFSVETLRKKVSKSTKIKISYQKMWNILSLIVVTDLVKKIKVHDIPKDLFDSIIQEQMENSKQIRHSTFYSPADFSKENIGNMEGISETLKENDINVRSLSFETVYRLWGEEKANNNFPQAYKPLVERNLVKMSDVDSNITEYSSKVEKLTEEIILSEIEKKGYIFEDELIKKLRYKLRKKTEAVKSDYRKIRADTMIKYNLNRQRATKDIFTQFNIIQKYSPKTIIFREL